MGHRQAVFKLYPLRAGIDELQKEMLILFPGSDFNVCRGKTVLKYVENHYTEKLTIDDMAELTYYSKSHFMKFFKAHMGIGFTEYLNDYRLTMAARLLK